MLYKDFHVFEHRTPAAHIIHVRTATSASLVLPSVYANVWGAFMTSAESLARCSLKGLTLWLFLMLLDILKNALLEHLWNTSLLRPHSIVECTTKYEVDMSTIINRASLWKALPQRLSFSQFLAKENPVSDFALRDQQFLKSVVYEPLLSCCAVALNTSKTPIPEAPTEEQNCSGRRRHR